MSKPFMKQSSLESPGFYQHQRRRVSHEDEASPKPLNRSLTLTERGTGGGAKRPRLPSSPLKRFTRAKEGILKAYSLIRDRLAETMEFMQLSHGGADSPAVAALLERTRGIEDILSRDHMKVGVAMVKLPCDLVFCCPGCLFRSHQQREELCGERPPVQ